MLFKDGGTRHAVPDQLARDPTCGHDVPHHQKSSKPEIHQCIRANNELIPHHILMSYSSYIAGLDLPFTGSQAFNGLAWTTAAWAFYRGWPGLGMKNKVEAKAGKAVHMPPGRRGELITALHGIPLLLPGATFLISLPLNNFETPDWLSQFALPPVSPDVYCGTRVGASLGILVSGMLVGAAFKHLGAQWNYIGVSLPSFMGMNYI